MKRLMGILLALGALVLFCPGCYTLKSQSIPIEMKTVNIGFFENDAPFVVSNLSQTFTEALKDRVRTTTRLSIVTNEGDASMTGSITDYHVAPVAVQATTNNTIAPIANAEGLFISVRVKFSYDANKKLNFEQVFTKQVNFTGDITAQQNTLIQTAVKQLIDDIFNRAFNNW